MKFIQKTALFAVSSMLILTPTQANAYSPDEALNFNNDSYPFSFTSTTKDTDLRPHYVKQEVILNVKGNDQFYESTYGKLAHHLTYIDRAGKTRHKVKATTRGRSAYKFTLPSLPSGGQIHHSLQSHDYGLRIDMIDRATSSSFKSHSTVAPPNQLWKDKDHLFVDYKGDGILLQYVDAKGKTIDSNVVQVLPMKDYKDIGYYPLTQQPKQAVSVRVWTYKGKYRSTKPQTISLFNHHQSFKQHAELTIDNKAKWSNEVLGQLHWFSSEVDRQKEFIQYELYMGKTTKVSSGAPYLTHTKYLGATKMKKDDRYQFSLKTLQRFDSPYDAIYLVAKTTKGKVLVSTLSDGVRSDEFDNYKLPRPLVSIDFDRSAYSFFPTIDTRTVTVRTYPKDANVSVWSEYADGKLIKSVNGYHTFSFTKPLKRFEEYGVFVEKDGYATYQYNSLVGDGDAVRPTTPTVSTFTKTSISGSAKPGSMLYVVNSKGQGVHFERIEDNGRFKIRFHKTLSAGTYTILSYSEGVTSTSSIKRSLK